MADPSFARGPTAAGQRGRDVALLAMAVVTGALAGCIPHAINQGVLSEPVLITGQVVAVNGQPVPSATLLVNVLGDGRTAPPGVPNRGVFSQSFEAGPDGTFTLHLAPTPALRAAGVANGGFVNFQITAIWGPEGQETIAVFAFPRELGGQGWADAPPTTVLRPIGVPVPPALDPNLRVPQPVES